MYTLRTFVQGHAASGSDRNTLAGVEVYARPYAYENLVRQRDVGNTYLHDDNS